jgi:exopolysaccharide production protein ExoZ
MTPHIHGPAATQEKSSQRPELISIQYLRAVAAIAVVFYHIGSIFHLDLEFCGAAVDVFFVISGFIMWMVTRQKEASPSIFLKKRLLRIVPLYWLVTISLATCATLRPNLFPVDHPALGHVVLSLFFVPHLTPDGNLRPLVGQGWTLNYEMFFYFLFTMTMAAFRTYQFYVMNIILLACVVCGYLTHASSPAGIVYTSPLLMEFLAGIYICRAWLNNTVLSRATAWTAIALGIAGIMATFGAYVAHWPLPRIIGWGVPSALIVLGAVSLESRNRCPNIGWLKILGDASYSIYLTHYLVWLAVSIAVAKLGGSLSPAIYLVTICAATLGGVVTHVVVEKPMGRLLARRFAI